MGAKVNPLWTVLRPSHLRHLPQLIHDIKQLHFIHISTVHIYGCKFIQIHATVRIDWSIEQFVTIFLRQCEYTTVVGGGEENHANS